MVYGHIQESLGPFIPALSLTTTCESLPILFIIIANEGVYSLTKIDSYQQSELILFKYPVNRHSGIPHNYKMYS
jgi:hypothetical protein